MHLLAIHTHLIGSNMNKRVFIIISIFSLTSNTLSAGEDVILWDFGVKISQVKTMPSESHKTVGINEKKNNILKTKKAALSNRHINAQRNVLHTLPDSPGGRILATSSRRPSCSELKFDTPMFLVSPVSRHN